MSLKAGTYFVPAASDTYKIAVAIRNNNTNNNKAFDENFSSLDRMLWIARS